MPAAPRTHSPVFSNFPEPYWSSDRILLYHGRAQNCLKLLPSRSVHCVVTSPPYWGLRDYGEVEQIGSESSVDCGAHGRKQCGDCFVCSLLPVFFEVRRVLRDDGTLWLNLGDSYKGKAAGAPWRVAMALEENGWILEQDIIWNKLNAMPESVMSRCTKAHEYIFLLTKSEKYFFDVVAITESSRSKKGEEAIPVRKRDVWTVPSKAYPGQHFATFPPELITPCILAGTSERGCCISCKQQYERISIRTNGQSVDSDADIRDRSFAWSRNGLPGSKSTLDGVPATRETIGWRKTCRCLTDEVVPCTVLDPFIGSGTTAVTARELGRAGIGVDISEAYLRDCAIPRIIGTQPHSTIAVTE